MEIDIFPLPHRKEGIARNFDKVFLGILIITYIIAVFKTAQCIVGNDAEKEFVCFLLAILIFLAITLCLRSICFMSGLATPNLQAFNRRCATQRAHIQSKLMRTS